MIRTSVIPCLSSGWLQITKLCPRMSYFIGVLGLFESSGFFSKMGGGGGGTNLEPH